MPGSGSRAIGVSLPRIPRRPIGLFATDPTHGKQIPTAVAWDDKDLLIPVLPPDDL
jgi:hypothetical protein